MDETIVQTINDEQVKMTSSSSCLIPNANADGYLMNVRYVNYCINPQGGYHNCDKHIITVNKYVELDTNLKVTSEKWMDVAFNSRRYIGVEDVRIFSDVETKQLSFIGTGFHQNNQIGIVAGNYNADTTSLAFQEITPNFNKSGCEKNWIYVDYKNATHVIYNWNPMSICKIDNATNELCQVETKTMPAIFSRVRGSTCGFKYTTANLPSEIWFIVHMVSYEDPRHYYHMIAVFDEHLNLLRYSAPFKFEDNPIEYCLSIVVEDSRVLINYSAWDRTTRIGLYDKKYIDALVKYV
jgi:hypothetical protein